MSDKYPGNLITGPSSGYSVYFNGVNSYLMFTKDLGLTADCTIEFWLYPVSQPSQGFLFMGVTTGPYIYIETLNLRVGWPGTWALNPIYPLPALNRWNHMALVRTSGVVRLYVNGISTATANNSSTFGGSQQYGVGAENTGSTPVNKEFFMTSLRVSNIARYSGTSTTSANFGFPSLPLSADANTKFLSCQTSTIIDQSASPATITVNGAAAVSNFYLPSNNPGQFNPALGAAAPGVWSIDEAAYYTRNRLWPIYDPNFPTTTLMLHGNGANAAQNNTFLDSSANNFTITRNGNTTQGTFSPFSQTGWSNYFDGTGDYLALPSSANLAPGAVFTFEAWIYAGAPTAGSTIYSATTSGELQVGYEAASNWGVCSRGVGWRLTSTTLPIQNQWNHVVISRGGTGTNQTSLFLNGVRVANGTVSDAFSATAAYQVGWDGGSGGVPWSGYISNLRFVKNGDIYGYTNTTITVPTAPLTTTVPSGTAQLLTCQSNRFKDNSANNFTETVNGNPTVQAYSPFSPAVAYAPEVIGGSGYFDGTTDYLSSVNSAAFAFGTAAWTIEFWVYPLSFANRASFVDTRSTDSSNFGLNIYSNPSSGTIGLQTGGTIVFTSSATLKVNSWNYVAITSTGTSATLYLDGVSINTGTYAQNLTDQLLRVGATTTSIGSYLNGYMSGLRITKGGVLSISVPTLPPTTTVSSGTVSALLNFTNAGILDSTARNNFETVGNTQVSTSVTKYGSGSIFLNPTYSTAPTGYLYQAASYATTFGLGNFTVEFWFNWITTASRQDLFWWKGTKVAGILWNITAGNVSYYIDGVAINAPLTPTPGAWYHIALSRSAGVTKLFINGVQGGSNFADVKDYTGVYDLYSGRDQGASSNWANGYIDELRITRGVARYTANFTPPTSQLQDQ